MKKLRRWISMLLAFCLLTTAMPVWVLAESAASSTTEPEVTATPEPKVTATLEPKVTATLEPEVTATLEPEVTGTPEPEVTVTPEPEVTATPEPEVTATPEPEVTGTPEPEVTATPEPEVTATPEPEATGTPESEATGTPEPEAAGTPEPEVTVTPEPEAAGTPEPEVTGTPEPEVPNMNKAPAQVQSITLPAPQTDLSYREETVTVTLPELDEGIDKAAISLSYELDGQTHSVDGAFAQGNSCAIALKDLGLPGAEEKSLRFSLSYEGQTGDAAALNIPARPGESAPGTSGGGDLVFIEFVTEAEIHYIKSGYDVGLSKAPGAGAPDIIVGLEKDSISSGMEANYSGLEADTEYVVYYRENATDTSFRSEWHRYGRTFRTEPYRRLSVSFNDPIRVWDASKPVSEAIIKASLIFTDEYGMPYYDYSEREFYTVEVLNARDEIVDLPITEPGDYKVKVAIKPDSSTAKDYQLAKDAAEFSIVRLDETDARIDYRNEKIIVRRPQDMSADSAEFSLKFALDGREYTADNVFAGGGSYAIDLATLSMMLDRTLPGESGEGAASIMIELYADGERVQSHTLTVPARPVMQKPEGDLLYDNTYYTQLHIIFPVGYDIGLKLADKAGSRPDIFGDSETSPGLAVFTGITAGAEYEVCLRSKATGVSFSSSWESVQKITTRPIQKWLSVSTNVTEYEWDPNAPLEEGTIIENLVFTDQDGNIIDHYNDYWYDIEVRDDVGGKIALPIRNPGVYTVRVIGTDDFKDELGVDFNKDHDTVEIEVLLTAPGPYISYADEKVCFELPSGLKDVASNISLTFALGDKTYPVPNAFADGISYAVSLSELGAQLDRQLPPSNADGAVEMTAELSVGDRTLENYVFTVPARPQWITPAIYYTGDAASIWVHGIGDCDVELWLKSDAGDVMIPGDRSSSYIRFENLTHSTTYNVRLRNKAAGDSFASEWYEEEVKTKDLLSLDINIRNSEHTWAPGFSLSGAEIRQDLYSTETETGEEYFNHAYSVYENAQFEITDEEGKAVDLPIELPGEYSFKFIPVEEEVLAEGCRFVGDTFTISVQPIKTPGVHLDYSNEAVTVVLPDELSGSAADASLKFTLGDQTHTVPNAFADGSGYAVSLSELGDRLGAVLPGEGEAGAADVGIELSIGGVAQAPYTLHIPGRPAYSAPAEDTVYAEGVAIDIVAVYGEISGFNVRLTEADEPYTEIPATYMEENYAVEFGSLQPGSRYTVYLSNKATEENFRSAWHKWQTVSTRSVVTVNAGTSVPKYVWKSGFELKEDKILDAIRFTDAENGLIAEVYDYMYTIEVTDADGQPALPIEQPGVYTVQIIPDDSHWSEHDGMILAEDSFEITVSIQAEAKVDFANEAVEVSLPKGLNADGLGDIDLIFALNGVRHTFPDAFENGSTRAVSLKELSELFEKPLPGENGTAQLYVMLASDDVVEETPYRLSIPERPASPGTPQVACEAGYTDITISEAAAYDAGLSPAGEAGGAPALIGEKQGGNISFANLTDDTAYALYLRTAATSGGFSSAWEKQPDEVKTKKLTRLNAGTDDPNYVWASGESGAPLDEAAIRDRLRFTDAENPERIAEVLDETYAIEVIDANGGAVTLPVNKPGVYTVRIVETEAWTEGYVLEKDSFDITISIQPGADIDFFKEEITVTIPEGLDGEVMKTLALTFELNDGTAHTVPNAFADGGYTVALSDLGKALGSVTLPDASQNVTLAIRLPGINGVESMAYTMSIPKRLNTLEIQPYATANAGGCTQMWASRIKEGGEAGLKPADEEGDEPTIFGEWRDNGDEFGLRSVLFSGLTPGTEYRLYIRSAATKTSFQTLWQDVGRSVSTNPISIYLQAAASPDEYDWFSGFSLDAAAIQDSIVNKSAAGLEYEPLGTPDIEVTDERGDPVTLPIKDPGVYTVRAILSEADRNAGRAYAEGKDTFTITVKLPDAGGLFIDYAEETVIVKLPDALKDQAENVGLSFTAGDAVYSAGSVFAGDRFLFTISLSDLAKQAGGPTLPPSNGAEAVELTAELLLPGDPAHSFTETINPRPEAPENVDFSLGNHYTKMEIDLGEMPNTPNIALKRADGQMIYPSRVEGDKSIFTGLTPGTEYGIYACTKATEDSFRSDWVFLRYMSTTQTIKLQIHPEISEYTWKSGFSLDEEDIRSVIKFYHTKWQDYLDVEANQYTIEVLDFEDNEVDLPIQDPGQYTVRVIASDTLPDKYEIDADKNAVALYVDVEASVGIDYVKEELTVSLPEGLDAGIEKEMEVGIGRPEVTPGIYGDFENGSYTIPLSDLGEQLDGSTLPDENGAERKLEVMLTSLQGMGSKRYPLTIPARPEAKNYPYPELPRTSVTSMDVSPADGDTWNMIGLREVSDPGAEPNILPSSVNGNVFTFTNLTPGVAYTIFLCEGAAEGRFRSKWNTNKTVMMRDYTYLNAIPATSVYPWKEGFSLDEDGIRSGIMFLKQTNIETVTLTAGQYAIAVTDDQGKPVILPIEQPGKYTVTVTGTDALPEEYKFAESSFEITVSVQPEADIDFFKEEITVTIPEGLDGEVMNNLTLTFEMNGREHTVRAADTFADGSYTVALSELGAALGGAALPDESGAAARMTIRLSAINGVQTPYSLTIPARPDCPEVEHPFDLDVGVTVIEVDLRQNDALSLALKPTSDSGSEPTIFPSSVEGEKYTFTGLTASTDYTIYACAKATEDSFCSKWGELSEVTTGKIRYLRVSATREYLWKPDFSLDESAIRNSLIFVQESDGMTLLLEDGQYDISVTDHQNQPVKLPIEQPGRYTVKVTGTDALSEAYVFRNDVAITVKPLDLSDSNVSISLADPQAVYTGEAVYPELGDTGIRIAIDGKPAGALTSDYYTIGAVQGRNNVNAGEAWMTISAKNGQSCVLGSKEIAYAILPQQAELSVNEELCQTVWSKGFSLTQEALSKVFAVSDAAGKPLSGEWYTFSMTREGNAVELPVTSAGSYTVAITLTTGNYALEKNTFAYTVSQLPFVGTVSMNGYVYGETPSQPVLSGYAGDGGVSFWYRAGQDGEWQKWGNITPTSLLPGSYEIKAIAEATANSAGGETAAAQFTVSPMELGAAIEMNDYTYGGTVPVPALVPAIEGLSVEWFYQGADGAEHPWANMTGTTLNAGGYTLIARVTSDVYGDAELRASFTVQKAKAPAFQWPTAEGITYGQPLSEVKLSAESDEFGAFGWANPEEILNAGEQKAALNYIPKDAVNYDYTGVECTKAIGIVVSAKAMDGEEGKDFTIAPIPEQSYTGEDIEPKLDIKDGDKQLTEGVDYSVSYTDNVEAGKATVTITGMGNYSGTLTVEFVIREEKEEDDKDDGEEDKDEDEDGEALTPDEQAEKLAEGQAVDGVMTDRTGEPAPYEAAMEELLDEAQSEVIRRTLVIAAMPVLGEDGQPILKDGEPVYQQRNLHLSRALLNALADKGYTHIRFELKDAALEWMIAEMTGANNVIRLAPMEEGELSKAERKAIGEAEALTGSYRARITAVADGEEADITSAIPSLTVIFDKEHIRALAEDETAQLLIVPGDGEPEALLSDALLAEDAETGRARYEAALIESGLFLMKLQ